jgi:hypothetical protein
LVVWGGDLLCVAFRVRKASPHTWSRRSLDCFTSTSA